MSDISKCGGQKCPVKNKCYRFLAPKSEFMQAWFSEVPYDHEIGECEFFYKAEFK